MNLTQRITWGGVFDPARLAAVGKSPEVRWARVRSDHFTGTAPLQPNGVMTVAINATATLVATDRSEVTLSIRIDPTSSKDADVFAMIGMNGCETKAAYDFRRKGGWRGPLGTGRVDPHPSDRNLMSLSNLTRMWAAGSASSIGSHVSPDMHNRQGIALQRRVALAMADG